jgi:diacylglycerol kinase (ATP)
MTPHPNASPGAPGKTRVLLICNKSSRRGGEALDEAMAQLEAHPHFHVTVADCAAKEDLSPIIASRRDACDLVILGGGDGTMNAAAKGLIEARRPLGILPLGTANDLARSLGIPEDITLATNVIIDGRRRSIDLGEVNGNPFFNVASIGLSADLAAELTSELKRRFGRVGYAIAALSVLLRAEPFRATIEANGRKARALTLQIAVGNGLYYGGGMAIDKNARIDDGTLDLYSLEMRRAWKLALMARAFRYGEHGAWREVRVEHAQAFRVRTRRSRPVNADGELVTQTPAEFRILPKAIEVFVGDVAPGLLENPKE